MTAPKGTAVVTGASSGIGAAFARRLAVDGFDLVVVARRRARLQELGRDLGGSIEVLTADLADRSDLERVATRAAGRDITMLVNAAGFGTFAPLASSEPTGQVALVDVALAAPIRLITAALPGMVARRHGAIISVASIGAFMASPDNATYCASKAGLVSLTRSLAIEVRDSGVVVEAVCPGFTRTKFYDSPAYATTNIDRLVPGYFWGSSDAVVSAALANLGRSAVVVPRLRDRLLVFALRVGLARYPRAAGATPVPMRGA